MLCLVRSWRWNCRPVCLGRVLNLGQHFIKWKGCLSLSPPEGSNCIFHSLWQNRRSYDNRMAGPNHCGPRGSTQRSEGQRRVRERERKAQRLENRWRKPCSAGSAASPHCYAICFSQAFRGVLVVSRSCNETLTIKTSQELFVTSVHISNQCITIASTVSPLSYKDFWLSVRVLYFY